VAAERSAPQMVPEETQEREAQMAQTIINLTQALEHERARRRNRWVFYLGVAALVLAATPVVIFYVFFLIHVAEVAL
jgi:t-SNARE complex subunit (syntaxin)